MKIIKSNNATRANRKRNLADPTAKQLVGPPPVTIQQNDAGHSIKVNRTDDAVDSIEVTCACGCQILIRCDYE